MKEEVATTDWLQAAHRRTRMDDVLGDDRGGSGDQDAFQHRTNSFDDPPPKDEHAIHRLQSIKVCTRSMC